MIDIKLLEVFRFLGLDQDLFNENLISFRFVNDNIKATYFEDCTFKQIQIGETTKLDIERLAELLRLCEGMRKEDDLYELIYSKPFLIQIPKSLNHILINRVESLIMPHPTLTRLWDRRVPYHLNEEVIIYQEKGKVVKGPHEGQKLLKSLKKMYYQMAYEMNSFSAQHSSGSEDIQKHTETVTLPNGDLIIIHFAENAEIVDMSHMMK
ncbi:hypothetical protein [Paenibacillus agricola]|uniref:Uncharacterized protein n=1 Tax=Paenibacillus agricola TaxID=2716264 RepID=A0ABX0JD86_9BACL|nr:hypothetical protein [Paenibacillus agricola]NHN34394.1 hypothetical protein [Paenibacillus agricola]